MRTLLDDLLPGQATDGFLWTAWNPRPGYRPNGVAAIPEAFRTEMLSKLEAHLYAETLAGPGTPIHGHERLSERYQIVADVNDQTADSFDTHHYGNAIHVAEFNVAAVLTAWGIPVALASAEPHGRTLVVTQIQGRKGYHDELSALPWREGLVSALYRHWAGDAITEGAIVSGRRNQYIDVSTIALIDARIYARDEDPFSLSPAEERARIDRTLIEGRLHPDDVGFTPARAKRAYDGTARNLMRAGWHGSVFQGPTDVRDLDEGDFVFDLTRLPA